MPIRELLCCTILRFATPWLNEMDLKVALSAAFHVSA